MIGLLGATGEIGNQTYVNLKNLGVNDICFFVRNTIKIEKLLSPKITVRQFDFADNAKTSFKNIRSLLWILPNDHGQIDIKEKEWINLAKSHGVEHIVKLSVMRVEEDDIFNHRKFRNCFYTS